MAGQVTFYSTFKIGQFSLNGFGAQQLRHSSTLLIICAFSSSSSLIFPSINSTLSATLSATLSHVAVLSSTMSSNSADSFKVNPNDFTFLIVKRRFNVSSVYSL